MGRLDVTAEGKDVRLGVSRTFDYRVSVLDDRGNPIASMSPEEARALAMELIKYAQKCIHENPSYTRDVDALFKEYTADNAEEVRNWLLDSPNLLAILPVLIDAIEPLRQCFGKDKRLQLSNFGGTLAVCVLWPGAPTSANQALEKFDETWLYKNFDRMKGDITFTYELV